MKDYSTFIFEKYAYNPDKGIVELSYSLDGEVPFTETLELPTSTVSYNEMELDQALFLLHIIGGISYYKTCLPKAIEVRSGTLTKSQAEFFNTLYEEGLGEFFFRNDIDFRGLINFPVTNADDLPRTGMAQERATRNILVPIGGGKDSIATIELLKKTKDPLTLFRLGSHALIDQCAATAELPLRSIKRKLSPELFKLNEEGALNGHVPITAYLSAVTVVTAILHGFTTIVLSNEKSSNEGNVEYLGKEINHQWSKSFVFEQMLQKYIAEYISHDLEYFSLLRPLSELSITQIVSQFPQYFGCMTSCNKNWKILSEHQTQRWCGECPKCAFAFALFAAFLPKKELIDMFGRNLFEEESLVPLYEEILGLKRYKPFECVGTPEETKAAFLMAQKTGDYSDTVIMKLFTKECAVKNPDELITESLALDTKNHAVPADLFSLLS